MGRLTLDARRYFDSDAFKAQIPAEGPRACPIVVPFTASDTVFDLNLLLTQGGKQMSLVQTVFVDNSANDQDVTLLSSVLNQSLIVPARSQAYLPLLTPKNATITISSLGETDVGIDFLNVPLPAVVWAVPNAVVVPPWVEALRAPSGDLPAIVLDYANGQYWGLSAVQAVGAILTQDLANWGAFDPSSIVPGQGLDSNNAANNAVVVHGMIPLSFFSAGMTALVHVANGAAALSGRAFIDLVDFPTFNNDYSGTSMVVDGVTARGRVDPPSGGHALDDQPYVGLVKTAENFGFANMAASCMGAAFVSHVSAAPGTALTDIAFSFNFTGATPIYNALTALYPLQPDADLPAICGL